MNTTAILALAYRGDLSLDYLVFADTGCELPETYRYIREVVRPVCREMGVDFVTVRGRERSRGRVFTDLYSWCWHYRIIPLREYRVCTDKFKVRPINRWLKSELGGCEYELLIGFDAGERHRRAVGGGGAVGIRYPLIELGYTRGDCRRIIRGVGWPVPPRSGCYICPFATLRRWRRLYEVHPDLYAKAEALEKNSHKYPDRGGILTSQNIPLEELRKRLTNTRQADLSRWCRIETERDDFELECGMCHV